MTEATNSTENTESTIDEFETAIALVTGALGKQIKQINDTIDTLDDLMHGNLYGATNPQVDLGHNLLCGVRKRLRLTLESLRDCCEE